MQQDFHYYATYCAAFLAGFSHEESMEICYSAEFVDHCSRTLLRKIKGPVGAATTQLQMELMDMRSSSPTNRLQRPVRNMRQRRSSSIRNWHKWKVPQRLPRT